MKTKYVRLWLIGGILLFIGAVLYAATRKEIRDGSKSYYSQDCVVVLPTAKGYVNDFVNIFTEAERWQLDSLIGEHEKATSNQITIVTFDSSMMGKCDVEHYTRAIANGWGVGQKNKNNGVVIGIAPSLKQMRIENGKGIEKIISNTETKTLIDSVFTPYFKSANYFEGTKNGLLALFKKLL